MSEGLAFDHVGVSVSDLEVAQRFYAQVLGFDHVEHAFELPAHEIRGRVLRNASGVRVELFERRGSLPMARRGHPTEGALQQGWFQFALATHELDACYARIVSAGGSPVLAPRTAPDGSTRIAFVGDPDGNLIELVQRQGAA